MCLNDVLQTVGRIHRPVLMLVIVVLGLMKITLDLYEA